MKKQLYMECASGISGDMAVAALLDLGASKEHLCRILETLPVEEEYKIVVRRVKKAGLDVCDFDVQLPKGRENHDHDMDYLYGHCRRKEPGNVLEQSGSQEGEHVHGHTGAEHEHRSPKDIRRIFLQSQMSDGAKEVAERMLNILAAAEAKAHGIPEDRVHFHEVGALDSILDMASFAICFDELKKKYKFSDVIVTQLCEGQGTVRCRHGILPVPVPAVTNIALAHRLPLHILPVEGELVTPTGAAIAAAVRTTDVLPEHMVVCGVGLGAGKREYETPGFLRVFLVET